MHDDMDSELDALIDKLPPDIQQPLRECEGLDGLLEVVVDLGRRPEARLLTESLLISQREVTEEDIEHVIQSIGAFGEDNRAGVERTLHRISAIRNRSDKIIGLSLRVGRAIYGTIRIIEDLVFSGKSILLVGRPGVGKTTMLREVARVLADDARRRVVVVDTSNEIAGDGDIPHPGIGNARRMQVRTPALQHAVMIEAVENHMPEVIIVDEIGTELDAAAARTIAERGVQLVATAHGITLENLVMNPTLSDLVGGVQTVTLGDVEARRRQTQKTVQERGAPPTFEVLVEIQGWNHVTVHADVADVVDRLLRGYPVVGDERVLEQDGEVRHLPSESLAPSAQHGGGPRRLNNATGPSAMPEPDVPPEVTHILPYGINKGRLQQSVRVSGASIEVVGDIDEADLVVTIKSYYRRRTDALRKAEEKGKPVYVLRRNTVPQIEQFIRALSRDRANRSSKPKVQGAVSEAEKAAETVERGEHPQVRLNPNGAYIRHLQHEIAERYGLASVSTGREPNRHVVIYRR